MLTLPLFLLFSTRTRRHTNYLATLVIWKHIQNDVLRVNEVISQELQIWVVHSLFAAGVTSARRTTMSSTSSSSSACRLRAKDRGRAMTCKKLHCLIRCYTATNTYRAPHTKESATQVWVARAPCQAIVRRVSCVGSCACT